jgi:hypothetical protein
LTVSMVSASAADLSGAIVQHPGEPQGSNIFLVFGDAVVTPPLSAARLPPHPRVDHGVELGGVAESADAWPTLTTLGSEIASLLDT